MATLSRKNTAGINDGQWVQVYYRDEPIQVRTRGETDAYTNARSRALRNLAKGFGGKSDNIPVEMVRPVNCKALADHAFLDIDGLFHDEEKTKPVAAAEVKEILCDRQLVIDFEDLVDAMFSAQKLVQEGYGSDLKDVEGNSARTSGTT